MGAALTILLATFSQNASADSFALTVSGLVTSSSVNGAQVGAGGYTSQQFAAATSAVGSVTSNGLTGVSLWSLLGGNSAGLSDVLTPTPDGDNSKNAILRS